MCTPKKSDKSALHYRIPANASFLFCCITPLHHSPCAPLHNVLKAAFRFRTPPPTSPPCHAGAARRLWSRGGCDLSHYCALCACCIWPRWKPRRRAAHLHLGSRILRRTRLRGKLHREVKSPARDTFAMEAPSRNEILGSFDRARIIRSRRAF